MALLVLIVDSSMALQKLASRGCPVHPESHPHCATAYNQPQVLRQHRATLMTCAETFLADPLVDWTGKSSSRSSAPSPEVGETENPMVSGRAGPSSTKQAGRNWVASVLGLPSYTYSEHHSTVHVTS
jgi:hypothetical protein